MYPLGLEPAYDRPPEGLARGRFGAPPLVIGLLGALVVLSALVLVVRRVRRVRGRRS